MVNGSKGSSFSRTGPNALASNLLNNRASVLNSTKQNVGLLFLCSGSFLLSFTSTLPYAVLKVQGWKISNYILRLPAADTMLHLANRDISWRSDRRKKREAIGSGFCTDDMIATGKDDSRFSSEAATAFFCSLSPGLGMLSILPAQQHVQAHGF